MSTVEYEAASFRDPENAVFVQDGAIRRGLRGDAVDDWRLLQGSGFFARAQESGALIGTREVSAGTAAADGWDVVLEHDRIPFVSYPYEWTFQMMRDAALLHLQLVLDALDDGLITKDGYAYNVQWQGAHPVFIDVGSLEKAPNGPWLGYRQFCRTFLYPLLLEAHLGIPFQTVMRGNLEGFSPSEMRALFPGRRRFKKGVFKHVYIHSVAENKVTQGGQAIKTDLGKAGFGTELTRATVRKMHKLVGKLKSKRAESGWRDYRATCSYSDDDRAAKEAFLRRVLDGRHVALGWDLGANDGAFSRILAEHADTVVAVDSDDVTVDALYRSLRQDGPGNILPLVMDLTDPSPARGWRGTERGAFTDRGRPDIVLALALVHHLVIAANVPMAQVIDWFHSLGGTLIIEFVEPHDPMAQRLLGNKQAGQHDDYRIDRFEELLGGRFTIDAREQLPAGTRTLYLASPRT